MEYGRADRHRICDVRAPIVMYKKITFSFFSQDGSSVLHQAANDGHCETVKLLLTKYDIAISVLDYVRVLV